MSTTRKALVRLTAFAGFLALGTAIAAFQNVVPPEFAMVGIALFIGCLAGIGALAWRDRVELLAQREKVGRGQALVLLAAQLRDEDASTLESIAQRGGPSGEAARLILDGRAERARRRPEPRP